MLYQKLLSGEKPYHTYIGEIAGGFEKHRHPEIELAYCDSGSYTVITDNKKHFLKKGDLAVIGSMTAHEYPENDACCNALIIEVGPVLLSGYFDLLVRSTAENPLLKVSEKSNKELYDLLSEIIYLKKNHVDFSDLAIKGNLHKISAYLLREFESISTSEQKANEIRSVANIEKALQLIYENYKTPLTIEEVSELCGYSKSNFCKIFRRITGDTFHNVLNSYRIKMACDLLDTTNYSVETIAAEVGFYDAKTLCRVFKSVKGMTTGEYKKRMYSII